MVSGHRPSTRAPRLLGVVALVAAVSLLASCTSDGGSAAGDTTPGSGGSAGGTPVQGDGTFPGDYRIRGTNPDGSRYRGTLTVEGDAAGALALDWNTNGTYDGVGVVLDDLLAAAHGDDDTPCNAAVYPIANGRLDGRWVSYDGRGPNTEEAVAVVPGDPGVAGSYAIEGTNSDGDDYSGSMDIVAAGAAFEITRQVGGILIKGSALKVGEVLAVAFGDEHCAVVVYTMAANGHLDGQWGATGVQTPGMERARPDD